MQASRTLVCELDNYDLSSFVAVALGFGEQRFGYVVTPNVDHFIRLHDDSRFRELYAAADYILLDSRFLNTLRRVAGQPHLPVCTGSDLTAALFSALQAATDRVVVVGGSDRQIAALRERFALNNLAHHSPPMGLLNNSNAIKDCVAFVEAQSPYRFCLLALGSPQQEILARQLQARGIARGLTLCIGASVDFITGVERRAPRWMQRCGIEWAFRLAQNPRRMAKRYLLRGPRMFWLLRKTKFVLRNPARSQQ